MDSNKIGLDKQIKTAFLAVKKDIGALKQFQSGITRATVKNKKIISEIIAVIDKKINDISLKLTEVDKTIGGYNTSIKKLDDELYKNDIDVQKIKLEQEKLLKFKHAVDEQAKIKKDLYNIVEKFELKFGELDDMRSSLSDVEKKHFDSISEFKSTLDKNHDDVKNLYDSINEKMNEVNKVVETMTSKMQDFGLDFVNKKYLSSELKRVSKIVSDEIDVIYTKHLNVFEKELSRFKDEISLVKKENSDLKNQIVELNAKTAQVVAQSVSRDSFISFQQENFNNTLKVTNLLKDSINDTSLKTQDKFKNFAKDHQKIVNEIYDELVKLKTSSIDKAKFDKAVEELNKTLYKYYQSNLELTKLDVAYSNDNQPQNTKSFEKYFSYEELDEQKNNLETIKFDQPDVTIQPVEVKTNIKSNNTVISTNQPTKRNGFFKFVTNLFFDEIDVEDEPESSLNSVKVEDDKIIDLTQKVESADEITIDIKPDVKAKTPNKVSKGKSATSKSSAKSSSKSIKKSTSKKASSKSKKKSTSKKSVKKKSTKSKDDDVEVINLYD